MKNDEVRAILQNGLTDAGEEKELFVQLGKLLLPGIDVEQEAKQELIDLEMEVKASIQKALTPFTSVTEFGVTDVHVWKDEGVYNVELAFAAVDILCDYHDEIFNSLKRQTEHLAEDINLNCTIHETSVSLVETLLEKHAEDIRGLLKEGLKNNIPSQTVFEQIGSFLYGENNFVDMRAYDEICERADEYFRKHDDQKNKKNKKNNTFYVASEIAVQDGYGVDIEVMNCYDLRTVGKVFKAIAQHVANKNNSKVEICYRLIESIQTKVKTIPQPVMKKESVSVVGKLFAGIESRIS